MSDSGWSPSVWSSKARDSTSAAVGRWRFFIFLKGCHWFWIGGIRVLGTEVGAGLEGSNSVMRYLVPPVSFWEVELSSKVLETALGFEWGLDDGTEKESFMLSVLLSRIKNKNKNINYFPPRHLQKNTKGTNFTHHLWKLNFSNYLF